jgi:hypothetical protein
MLIWSLQAGRWRGWVGSEREREKESVLLGTDRRVDMKYQARQHQEHKAGQGRTMSGRKW